MSKEKKHSKYSPSQAYRYIACPGSVRLCEQVEPEPDSPYAIEGTRAHAVLTNILRNEKPDKCDSEMVKHAKWAAEKIFNFQGELYVDAKVKAKKIHKELSGTLDAAVAEPFGTLTIIDYKYGAGHAVDAIENEQMKVYALGLHEELEHMEFSKVDLVIAQPRAHHKDGEWRVWSQPIEVLGKWAEFFKKAIDLCEKPDAPLVSGQEQCRWCPAKRICPEFKKNFSNMPVAQSPAQLDFKSMTPQLIGETLLKVDLIEQWVSDLRAFAFSKLQRGQKIPGWKLVPKRASRKWNNEKEAAKAAERRFGENAFVTELLSPTQLEKQLGDKDFVKKYASSHSSGVTMVQESDDRGAVDDF